MFTGQLFNVHKVVLAASCPYFEKIFTRNTRDQIVNLPNVSPAGLQVQFV